MIKAIYPVKSWFRVISVQEARAAGATHEGKFLGLPIWAKEPYGYEPMVFAKWNAVDWLLPALAFVYVFAAWLAGDGEADFPLRVRRISR